METTIEKPEAARKERTGRLAFYRANGQGTGLALRFELRMNGNGEDRYDCIFMEMARQKTKASVEDGRRMPATFDWENKVTTKLDFFDVSEFLTVLEGTRERAGDGRNGLYHETGAASTLITLDRSPKGNGYYLGVSRKKRDGEQVFKGQMLLSEAEATGLRCVLQTSLFFMAFNRNLRR